MGNTFKTMVLYRTIPSEELVIRYLFEKITNLIESNHKVLTTSYFVPHLSQRQYIRFPESLDELNSINEYDILLLIKMTLAGDHQKRYNKNLSKRQN